MPRRTLWLIMAAAVISIACYERAERNPYGRWFAEIMETIDRHYVERVDDQKLFEGALQGMMSRLDDHSAFLPRAKRPSSKKRSTRNMVASASKSAWKGRKSSSRS